MSRSQKLSHLLKDLPTYRLKQIDIALFDAKNSGWETVFVLPKPLRETLQKEIPWITLIAEQVLQGKNKDVFKALLKTVDGKRIESVLMKNARDHWTLCVSSQVGCAMNCSFCATGKMGFTRNLDTDEIIDQYRFWNIFLRSQKNIYSRHITNIVYMGMGEPLANYENVKKSLNLLLKNTEIGCTRITVSTAGLLPQMKKILEDPEWPNVRIALSLHSADPVLRKKMMPSTPEDFFPELAQWMKKSSAKNPARRNHITFEYILIEDINERKEDAQKLIRFARLAGVPLKVNLIPYNKTLGNPFTKSALEKQRSFQKMLEHADITTTLRRPLGDDIAGACGQLAGKESEK